MNSIADIPSPASLLGALLGELRQAGVSCCLLGDVQGLPARIDSDVDLWVHPASMPRAMQLVRSLCRREGWALIQPNVSPRVAGSGEAKCCLLQRRAPHAVLQLDLWSAPHWRGLAYLDADVLARQAGWRDGLPVAPPSCQAGAALLKHMLYRIPMSPQRRQWIAATLADQAQSFLDLSAGPIGRELARKLVDHARLGLWGELGRMANRLRCTLLWRAWTRRPGSQIVRSCRYGLGVLRVGLFSRYGLLVALVGPDGAGKSTTIDALAAPGLADKLFARVRRFHTHLGFVPPLRRLGRAIGLGGRDGGDPSTLPRRLSPRPMPSCLVNPLYYGLWAATAGRAWMWAQRRRGGCLVLGDRYLYEYLVQPEYARCPRWLVRWAARAAPRADLAIILSADPAAIHARKGELPLDEIARQLDAYLGADLPARRRVVVDTSAGLEAMLAAARAALVEAIVARYDRS
jgi:thymidylate kinase